MNSLDSGDLLSKLSNYIPGVLYQFKLTDGHFSFPYASTRIKDILGLDPEDIKDDASVVFSRIHSDYLDSVKTTVLRSAKELSPWNLEFKYRHPMKGDRWIHGYSNPEKQKDGSVVWHGVLIDLTDKKEFEHQLNLKNHLLTLTSGINEMIVYSKTEPEIFQRACEIAIELGNYSLAWVGLVNDQNKTIEPVASAGHLESYLERLPPISTLDIPAGRGPSGRAFREKKTVVINDIENDEGFAIWKDKAREKGFKSSIALPLIINSEVIGTFNLYSTVLNFFNSNTIYLLENITRNISFAVESLKLRQDIENSEKKFRTIFDDAPMGIVLANAVDGTIIEANQRFCEILGRSDEDVKGMRWMNYTHPDDLTENLGSFLKLRQGLLKGFRTTKRYLRPDGSFVWVEALVVRLEISENQGPRNLVMVSDISERIKLEDDLRKSLVIKDEFIEIASHELKTPTTAIKLQLQMLQRKILKGLYDETAVNHEITNAVEQINKLVELVDRLLDVSEITVKHLKLHKEVVNLSQIVETTVREMQTDFKAAGCDLITNIESDIFLTIDPKRIKQVIHVILENAYKYAPGFPVDVELKRSDEMINLVIHDYGRGLDKEQLSKMFHRFERLDHDRSVSGLGVGLFIAKEIIEAHGGRMEAVSEKQLGTIFRVYLPFV